MRLCAHERPLPVELENICEDISVWIYNSHLSLPTALSAKPATTVMLLILHLHPSRNKIMLPYLWVKEVHKVKIFK